MLSVDDNGHWNYCKIILRRKGRKRYDSNKTEDQLKTKTMCSCADDNDGYIGAVKNWKLSYYHFPLESRLSRMRSRQPRRVGEDDDYHQGIGSKISRYRKKKTTAREYLHWLFIVCVYINYCLSPVLVVASAQTSTAVDASLRQISNGVYEGTGGSSSNSKEICFSTDVRNTVSAFHQLKDCRVIEGFLQIVLMDRTNESDFANLTFPKLREITGYLLLYRVNGLRSLANLFPNLSIIRGHDLFMNYALVVYEMMHLQELGLYSLTDIARGHVLITRNSLLCYIDTIDWSRIVASGKDANLILDNRPSNACPKCPNFTQNRICGYNNQTKQSNCWNAQHCQKTCSKCDSGRCTSDGQCCHPYCLGGCSGVGKHECYACKNVFVENTNQCADKCPDNHYLYKGRRCITQKECYDMPRPRENGHNIRSKPYKPFNGTCIIECPVGYEEVYKETEKLYKCEKCSGPCRKVCEAASVDSIQSAQRLKGCVVINGSLEIQIRGGVDVVKELEENLNMIEEITGYLKIVRSLPLVSLNFLRQLKEIKGNQLENSKYALVVLDNQNLAELWDFSRRKNDLKLGQPDAKIFFHFNPKLCYNKITELKNRLKISSIDDFDVAPNSNGDQVACNITTLIVSVAKMGHDYAVITWIPYSHYEMRTLLGYVVYVMEVPPNVNVSIYDGRDACGGDGWRTMDVEVSDPITNAGNVTRDNITHPVTHLKPYTRYAYYVKTYTIATEPNGAQSPIQYFVTNPSTPTPPRNVKIQALSSSEIHIEWLPPEQANGKLENYRIVVEATNSNLLLEQRNYCNESPDIDRSSPPQIKEEKPKKQTTMLAPEKKTDECKCDSTETVPKIRKDDEEIQALIEFENRLHNTLFVKEINRQHTNTNNNRTRRAAVYDDSHNRKSNSFLDNLILASNEAGVDPLKNVTHMSAPPLVFMVNHTAGLSLHQLNVTNLTHFTFYTVNIQACRSDIEFSQPSPCSTEKMETVQTLALSEADQIDEKSVKTNVINDTSYVRLTWDPPTITNGPILTYIIRYKRVDIDSQVQSQCISHMEFMKKKEYVLRTLSPGNYSLKIRAFTLAKDNEHFTAERFVYIPDHDSPDIKELMLGALIAVCIIIIILVSILIFIRYYFPDSDWYHQKLFASVNPEYFKNNERFDDKWEIPRKKIIMDKKLGNGHFGDVYEGRAKGLIEKGVVTRVAIKTLNKANLNERMRSSFLNEAKVMKEFDTYHVVRLLGVVTRGQPLVIMELMANGDLRTYLRSCRADVPQEERLGALRDPPTLREILQMAAEIADGMLYLSDKKYVHRDLAARNCMINAEGTVKIGDFGLTRDVYETDYYRKDSKGHLPVRWMAPESLRDGIFTSRSDVWSYGVVLWEMATLASMPYTGFANSEVMPYVVNGGIMEEPENCPPILAEIMRQCWQYKYTQRPSFSKILELLLPNIPEGFKDISYYHNYHTEEAIQSRASNDEAAIDEDTPYTPLRAAEDFEDFSLDNDENEDDCEMANAETHLSDEMNRSSENPSIRSLPTVNGYIRRPHNLIPLVNTKTTPC